ncbi:unnamed protein product [Dovyalis caffra]|uniref:Proteasome component Ecm29 N-terminal domain-containing protein n=1 Tax=Dovyalis caffra TaxID=77055 RepID=A0AAV1RBM8_9ROSI|nr:unnamed protein product [Dovyalis caffra]
MVPRRGPLTFVSSGKKDWVNPLISPGGKRNFAKGTFSIGRQMSIDFLSGSLKSLTYRSVMHIEKDVLYFCPQVAKTDHLKLVGPVILNGILKLLDNYSSLESDAIARDIKTFSFQAIGLLAQRLPHLFRDKIDMAVRLFDALKAEAESLRFVIQEATSSLAAAYKTTFVPLAAVATTVIAVATNTAICFAVLFSSPLIQMVLWGAGYKQMRKKCSGLLSMQAEQGCCITEDFIAQVDLYVCLE